MNSSFSVPELNTFPDLINERNHVFNFARTKEKTKGMVDITTAHARTNAVHNYQQPPTVIVTTKRRTKRAKPHSRTRPTSKLGGIPKSLMTSSFHEIDELSKFRKNVLSRSASTPDATPQKLTKQQVTSRALSKIRNAAERSLESSRYRMDLRGFQGIGLTPSELRYRFQVNFGLYLTPSEVSSVVEHLDLDRNGRIDYYEVLHKFLHPERLQTSDEEVMGLKQPVEYFASVMERIAHSMRMINLNSGRQTDFTLRELFQNFDQDNTGSISQGEFREAMSIIGVELSARELSACFKYMDPNGDRHVSYREFASAYFNRRELLTKIRRKNQQREKPPFLPNNQFKAREEIHLPHDISNDLGTPFVKDKVPCFRAIDRTAGVFLPSSSMQAREAIATNVFLDGADDALIQAQREHVQWIKAKRREIYRRSLKNK